MDIISFTSGDGSGVDTTFERSNECIHASLHNAARSAPTYPCVDVEK